MGDPKWKECFIPVFSQAIEVLSNLLGSSSNFGDKLIQAECVTLEQMDQIKIKPVVEAARELFGILRKRPKPMFNTFCEVLEEVEQGQDLLRLLRAEPQRSPLESCTAEKEVQLPTSMDRSGVSNVGLTANAKSEERTPVQARAQSLAGRLDSEEEAYQAASMAAGRVKETRTMQPANAETNSGAGKERPTILTVSVLRDFEKVYKQHKHGFRSIIKKTFLKVYRKRVKVDEVYPKKLSRSYYPSNFNFSVSETVAFRIVFPKLRNRQLFEPHRQRIVRELAGVMHIPERRIEIFVSDGSCVLSVEIPGDGFICFMAALDIPGRLDFLYTVDDEVIVKINGLFEIPLKIQGKQDEEALKFPSREYDSQLFLKETPVLSDDEGWSEAPHGTTGVLESLNRDAEKRFLKEKEIAEEKVKTLQSHSEIVQMAENFKDEVFRVLQPSSLDREGAVASALEDKIDDVLAYMKIAVTDRRSQETALKRAAVLFTKVCQSKDDRTKLQFAFALYAFCPAALDRVAIGLENDVHEIVCDKAMREGLSRCGPLRDRLNAALKALPAKRLSVLVVGRTGVGKSTLINSLFGKEVVEADYVYTTGRTTESYAFGVNNMEVKVWDIPMLGQYGRQVAEMRKVKDVDLLLLCVDATNFRTFIGFAETVKMITNVFGKALWSNAVLVFTKANIIRDPRANFDDELYLRKSMDHLASLYKETLERYGGLSKAEAESVPSVPVGSHRDKVLADGRPWLPELWVTAAEKTRRGRSKAVFIALSADRLQAAAEGGTGDQEERGEIQLSRQQTERIALEIRNVKQSGGIIKKLKKLFRYSFQPQLEYLLWALARLWELIVLVVGYFFRLFF